MMEINAMPPQQQPDPLKRLKSRLGRRSCANAVVTSGIVNSSTLNSSTTEDRWRLIAHVPCSSSGDVTLTSDASVCCDHEDGDTNTVATATSLSQPISHPSSGAPAAADQTVALDAVSSPNESMRPSRRSEARLTSKDSNQASARSHLWLLRTKRDSCPAIHHTSDFKAQLSPKLPRESPRTRPSCRMSPLLRPAPDSPMPSVPLPPLLPSNSSTLHFTIPQTRRPSLSTTISSSPSLPSIMQASPQASASLITPSPRQQPPPSSSPVRQIQARPPPSGHRTSIPMLPGSTLSRRRSVFRQIHAALTTSSLDLEKLAMTGISGSSDLASSSSVVPVTGMSCYDSSVAGPLRRSRSSGISITAFLNDNAEVSKGETISEGSDVVAKLNHVPISLTQSVLPGAFSSTFRLSSNGCGLWHANLEQSALTARVGAE